MNKLERAGTWVDSDAAGRGRPRIVSGAGLPVGLKLLGQTKDKNMSNDVGPADAVKAPSQPADRKDAGDQRAPGASSLFPGKSGPPPGRSPLFRR